MREIIKKVKPNFTKFNAVFLTFIKSNYIGLVIILIATIVFFLPIIIRISSYNPGGDGMFNAWTLARNQHCILRQGCPNYVDGNIFFPNSNSMLYSETQLSTGLLSLPLYFINSNPVFSNNVMTILSFLFSGWFMYLLAKRLSKNNELFSVTAGLIFEFAPFKIIGAFHLQNQSILYLPLIILLILKYKDNRKNKYLIGLFFALVLLFFASWYQMVFVLIALGTFLIGSLLFKYIDLKGVLIIGSVISLATFSTLPLALKYIEFSKTTGAKFSIPEQALYASRVSDYFIPQTDTIAGDLVRKFKDIPKNSYNPDSVSYHSVILYIVAFTMILAAFINRKTKKLKELNKTIAVFSLVGLVGLILSFGPLLQFSQQPYTYVDKVHGTKIVFALPYILFSILLPQLAFIRAIGRISVIFLFVLCILLALMPVYLDVYRHKIKKNLKVLIYALVFGFIIFELMPTKQIYMSTNPYSYNLKVPSVYEYIKDNKDVDNLVILAPDLEYSGGKRTAPTNVATPVYEQVLWAGYHNKNIYNGYSGYFPSSYAYNYQDYLDFEKDDIPKLNKINIRYILVDKLLSSTDKELNNEVNNIVGNKMYEDDRYSLYKI